MTIGGALSELNNLLNADDIPCYYKPSIKAVMDTIALDQEPRWIPISERLPKEYEPVILSTDEEEVFIARYLGKMDDGTDCFDDEDGMMWEGDVIAWMPLPKPYKAESENT